MDRIAPWLLGLCLAFVSASVTAATLGKVVAITDGDTLTVLIDQKQVKVRLAEIDAPESRQPFGTRSRQALADLCHRQQATLEELGRDRYGRTIARVTCAGIDANAEQVRHGMAWVFDRYARPDSPLYALQDDARARRVGLWQDKDPIPPWKWRRAKR